MDDVILWVLLAGVGGTIAFVLPIVAAVKAGRARREVASFRMEVSAKLDYLYEQLTGRPAPAAGAASATASRAATGTETGTGSETETATETATETVTAPEGVPAATTMSTPPSPSVSTTTTTSTSTSASESESASASAAPFDASAAFASASAPAPAPVRPADPFEARLMLTWGTRIGAAILLLGVAYFFKYLSDNSLIGPTARVALIATAGALTVVVAEWIRARTRAMFVQALIGVGLALLLLSAYASHAFYHLVAPTTAFGLFFAVTLAGGALAVYHRGEAILILSLAAALAAPVLLSTGVDRAFALFSYLFIVTALADATCLRMNFRWAMWLGIVGTAVLFTGWYDKFFDAHPMPAHPEADLPAEQLIGPYFALSARAVPLGFVGAFLAEWLAVWWLARRSAARGQGGEKLWPPAILLAAALLAHVGAAALLYDHLLLLGSVLVALGALSTWLFAVEGKSELLALPLLASFGVLVATVHRAAGEQPTWMLGLLAAWAGIYVAGFLRGQLAREEKPSGKTLALVGGVGLLFAILTSVLLGEGHVIGFVVVLVALSLGYSALGVTVLAPPVVGAAISLSFLFLVARMPKAGETDLPFVAVCGAWAAVYLGAMTWELVVKRLPPTAVRLLITSGAGLGFAVLAESHTGEHQSLLRATLLALVGAIDLGLGATLLRRDAKLRRPATVLLGQALGLFAAAVALLFSGVTVTLVWAVLAAVVTALAASEADPLWLAGGMVVFGAVLVRVVGIDALVPHQLVAEYLSTGGRTGALTVAPFLNPSAYAFAGAGVALLVGARAVARVKNATFRGAALALVTLGHALVLTLLVIEIHRLLLTTPAQPQARLPEDEFRLFVEAFSAQVASQEQKLHMITTLLMGVYAAGMVGYGFGVRDRLHRLLGLSLFGLTLGKLALWDVWQLARVYQILTLVAVGGLLLGASFLYARFGRRLIDLVRDGAGPAVVLALMLLPARARAFDPKGLAQVRPIEGVSAPGFYRVEVDPALYRASQSETAPLADLRIAGPDGHEAPYFLRRVPEEHPPLVHPARLVDPVELADRSTRAVFDLGRHGLKHSLVNLELSGTDFLRVTRVEISDDERHWARLAEGARVWRIGPSDAEHTQVGYPVSDARYLRITLLPAPDRRLIPIRGGSVLYEVSRGGPKRESQSLPVRAVESDHGNGTRVLLDLGERGVPWDAIVLSVKTPAFERRALVAASDHQTYWPQVGTGMLWRAPAVAQSISPEEDLRLAIEITRKRWARIEIVDGDNPPLAIDGAFGEWHAEELVFQAAQAGPHTLYVGAPALHAPSYDLPSVLSRAGDVKLERAKFGALSQNPVADTAPAIGNQPWSERNRGPIGIALAVLLGGLALVTVRLIRKSGPPRDGGSS